MSEDHMETLYYTTIQGSIHTYMYIHIYMTLYRHTYTYYIHKSEKEKIQRWLYDTKKKIRRKRCSEKRLIHTH